MPFNFKVTAEMKYKLYKHIILGFIHSGHFSDKDKSILKKFAALNAADRKSLIETTQKEYKLMSSAAKSSVWLPELSFVDYVKKVQSLNNWQDFRDLCIAVRCNRLLVTAYLSISSNRDVLVEENRSYFEMSLEDGYEDLAKEFILRGYYDINHQNKQGNTVLHEAVCRRDLKKIEFILSFKKARLDLLNKESFTPILLAAIFAATGGMPEIFRLFMVSRQQETIDCINKKIYLFYAIRQQNSALLELLLQHGADPEILLDDGKKKITALGFVLLLGLDEKFAESLLKYGANINYRDELGISLLFSLIKANKTEQALMAINVGADIRQAENVNPPYFYLTLQHRNVEIAKALLEKNYIINHKEFMAVIFERNMHFMQLIIAYPNIQVCNYFICSLLSLNEIERLNIIKSNISLQVDVYNFHTAAADLFFDQVSKLNWLNTYYQKALQEIQTSFLEDLYDAMHRTHLENINESTRVEADSTETLFKNELIQDILDALENVKATFFKLILGHGLPSDLARIDRDKLSLCSIETLETIRLRITDWTQKTILRLNKQAQSDEAVPGLEVLHEKQEKTLAHTATYCGIHYNQLDKLYPVENSMHHKLLFDQTLIADLEKITAEEMERFESMLNQLKLCGATGEQGIKRLETAIPCTTVVNGLALQDHVIQYELKLKSFAHRILLLSISPDSGSGSTPIILLACLLRHGSEHDRKLPSRYQLNRRIDLPVKPVINCLDEEVRYNLRP